MKQIAGLIILLTLGTLAICGSMLFVQSWCNTPFGGYSEPTPVTQTELSPQLTILCVQGKRFIVYEGKVHALEDFKTGKQEVCE